MGAGKHTPGPWAAVACGGYSVVLTRTEPQRNDNRIPSYGYGANGGHSIGYPFVEDDGRVRFDFVCFSHDDARLIAAAPDLLAALREVTIQHDGHYSTAAAWAAARSAIAKAEGR